MLTVDIREVPSVVICGNDVNRKLLDIFLVWHHWIGQSPRPM